jgi:hypothetical protein
VTTSLSKVFAVYPAPPYPLNYASYVAAAWTLVGVLVYILLRRSREENLDKFGTFTL